MEDRDPGKIGGFLAKFQAFMPTDRKVRTTLQAFLNNRLESKEVLQKDTVRCNGKIIYLNLNPYLKQELVSQKAEILALLRDRDHLFFDDVR